MSKTGWKQAERDAASLLHGTRFPANTGGAVDVETPAYVVQVKNRRTFSLAQLERTALEIERVGMQKGKHGVVMIKRSAGKGRDTPWLVAMTAGVWRELNGPLPVEESDS